jgi:AcrR family transcriptional regulator
MSNPTTATTDDPRRRKLLEAALGVFARYGFRKTSMDEVARAADMSRQGLYLHFASKEELFQATVAHTLETTLAAALAALADDGSLEARLVATFDAWIGRFVGVFGAGASDLAATSSSLAGDLLADHESRFVEAVAKAIRTAGLAAAYKPSGLTARQLADTLNATARGLKHSSPSREAFVAAFTLAARAMCMPLAEAA